VNHTPPQRGRIRTAAIASGVFWVAVLVATNTASGAKPRGHTYSCSIYRAPAGSGVGDAILTFSNWVAPRLPGGAHGEPPYDCVGAAAHLTVANYRSTDEWSTTRPPRFRKLGVACLVHFTWIGEYVTATLRSIYPDDPVCEYLLRHRGP
jgi:hypothetical protein